MLPVMLWIKDNLTYSPLGRPVSVSNFLKPIARVWRGVTDPSVSSSARRKLLAAAVTKINHGGFETPAHDKYFPPMM